MKTLFSYLFCLSFFCISVKAQNNLAESKELLVKKIWSVSKHSAFTSMIYSKGKFYCTFRESSVGHIPGKKTGEGDGEIRVISSLNGEHWESVALVKNKGFDLRDSKISEMPDGRLMLTIGGSIYVDGILKELVPQVSFSNADGMFFSEPQPVNIDPLIKTTRDWLWRVTWFNGIGYGLVYSAFENEPWQLSLLKTTDGINYHLLEKFDMGDKKPNEATVRFLKNGEMKIFLRCESANAQLGSSKPPYTSWQWTDLGCSAGGPDMIVLPDDNIIFAHRNYKEHVSTVISILDDKKQLMPVLSLPSAGDTSYPGLVIHDGFLWISYYSQHEETPTAITSIYLAKFPLPALTKLFK